MQRRSFDVTGIYVERGELSLMYNRIRVILLNI